MNTARLNHRTPFLGRVDIVPHAGAGSLTAWGQDVSETGIFLQTTQPFAVGDNVSIRFEVDGLEVHVRAATVVWLKKFEAINIDGKPAGVGLRFVSIDPPARAALRRLTAVKVANDTPANDTSVVNSLLPQPLMPLPPLSRSIIQAAGGRDLDDTQDLLPPSSLPRHTGEAISLPPLQFTQVPSTATPTLVPQVRSLADDVNLTSESRVFAGVPDAPRPITMLPRLRSLPPTKAPPLPMTTSIISPSAVLNSNPPLNAAVTQPMHSLPPIDAVDVFADWTFAKADGSAAVGSGIDEQAATTPPTIIDVADDAAALQLRFSSELLEELGDELGDELTPDPTTILNPSILEARSAPPVAADDSFSASDFFAADNSARRDDSPGLGTLNTIDDSGAYSFGPVSVSTPPTMSAVPKASPPMSVVSIAGESRLGSERRQPRRESARRSVQVAAVLLVAGCAAGGVVGMMSRASQKTAPSTSVTTAEVTDAALVAPAVMGVADAEAELFGKKRKSPAPVHVAVAQPAPVQIEVPVAVLAKLDAPKVDAPKVAAIHVAAPNVDRAEKGEATLTSTQPAAKKSPLTTKPGRLEVDLPEGGRVKKVFALAGPSRVVIDFEQARLPAAPVTIGEDGTLELRFGKPDAGTQRVVIVLDSAQKPDAVDARLDGDRLIATWHR